MGFLEGELLTVFWSKNEHNAFILCKQSYNIYCLNFNSTLELEDPECVPYLIKPKVISLKILNFEFDITEVHVSGDCSYMVVLYTCQDQDLKNLVGLFKLDLENYKSMTINFVGFLYTGGPKRVHRVFLLERSVEIVFKDYSIQSVAIFDQKLIH